MSAITIEVPEALFGKLKEVTASDHSTPEQFTLLALAISRGLSVSDTPGHGS